MSEEELAAGLEEYGQPNTGTREERQVALWEASLPVYKIPQHLPEPAKIIFAALLDEDGEPRPEGANRNDLVVELRRLGFPDEASCNQTIDTQVNNLIFYYGYRRVSSPADLIIVERRTDGAE